MGTCVIAASSVVAMSLRWLSMNRLGRISHICDNKYGDIEFRNPEGRRKIHEVQRVIEAISNETLRKPTSLHDLVQPQGGNELALAKVLIENGLSAFEAFRQNDPVSEVVSSQEKLSKVIDCLEVVLLVICFQPFETDEQRRIVTLISKEILEVFGSLQNILQFEQYSDKGVEKFKELTRCDYNALLFVVHSMRQTCGGFDHYVSPMLEKLCGSDIVLYSTINSMAYAITTPLDLLNVHPDDELEIIGASEEEYRTAQDIVKMNMKSLEYYKRMLMLPCFCFFALSQSGLLIDVIEPIVNAMVLPPIPLKKKRQREQTGRVSQKRLSRR